MKRRQGGPQSLSGCYEEIKLLSVRKLNHYSSDALSLYRLSYPGPFPLIKYRELKVNCICGRRYINSSGYIVQ
jgi:hypothetical protein